MILAFQRISISVLQSWCEANLPGSSLAASLLLSTYRNLPRKKSPALTALREKTFSEQYFGLSMEQILKQIAGRSQTTYEHYTAGNHEGGQRGYAPCRHQGRPKRAGVVFLGLYLTTDPFARKPKTPNDAGPGPPDFTATQRLDARPDGPVIITHSR